jgi:glycosyltransferase involved in cell wall biosynthesis
MSRDRPLRILTWQVHGNYMWYLSQVPHEWWLATKSGDPPGYAGCTPSFPWGDNVHAIPCEQIREADFDGVLYQSRSNWEIDRMQWMSARQRVLPAIYLEHDPPQMHPSNTRHWAADAVDLIVHVTPFNALMWDSGGAPTRVIEHTAVIPESLRYRGDLARGLTAVNHLMDRGRRLGADIYVEVQKAVPLDLVGMKSEEAPGGRGEVSNLELPKLMSHYRFLFSPARWTSLSLAVVEAMMLGLPIVALATTEMSTVIRNGRNGWIATHPDELVEVMQALLRNRGIAREWGENARRIALKRFGRERFITEWHRTLNQIMRRRAEADFADSAMAFVQEH